MKFLLQLFLVLIPLLLVLSCSKKGQRVYRPSGIFQDYELITPMSTTKPRVTTLNPTDDIQNDKITLNIYGKESLPFVYKCFEHSMMRRKISVDARKIAKCCNDEYAHLINDEKLDKNKPWEDYYKRYN